MMKNEVALKVYEVNYDFIIKNYLSPELWEKLGHYLFIKILQ